ncbi:MAG TPA: sulfatase-like hydrolase/transferase [Terriglobales bacterium]|nr:sulfatase-like hydrolase/transferase [Terriglobales bacterium]
MSSHPHSSGHRGRPNFLVLCMDQWDAHMQLPPDVPLPALRRLETEGVSFDRQYCTVPICTPSRASMWTGVHAKQTGLWDNTNFAWIDELAADVPTLGHLLRELGYYTAFKGKWHLSSVPHTEDALERFGFADCQQWGEMYGTPLQGEQLDSAAVSQTLDWLEYRRPRLDRPWLLVCSLINPHDIMFLQTDPIERPHPNGMLTGRQSRVQRLGWFERQWDLQLPANFDDDCAMQPEGVRHYKVLTDKNYGHLPAERTDLWLQRRNYLVNCMRRVDAEFLRVIAALDRLDLWRNTVVVLTSDHGEMNGAHRMTQKGAIHFDEAALVNLTVCAPGGPRGRRTAAVGSHLDLVPTLLDFAGVNESERLTRYPHLKGRSLKTVILDPASPGPRGDASRPGDAALYCWDGLHALDQEWSLSGALRDLADMGAGPATSADGRRRQLLAAGQRYGAPDFHHRTFYRAMVDGRYKLVRWFSPMEYANPATCDELYALGDVTLHDLVSDPGELENLGHPRHPRYDLDLIARLTHKLHVLVRRELGEDRCPFNLDLFGTRRRKLPGAGDGGERRAA